MTVTRTCPTCPHTGTYKSDAIADARFARHSCDRQRERAAIAGRQNVRTAARSNQDCKHIRARHLHGTRAAYNADHCRCPACTAANNTYMTRMYRDRAYGRWSPFVDAAPTREHLHALRAAGFSVNQIAATTGVSGRQIKDITRGRVHGRPASKHVRATTAQHILAMTTTAEPWRPGVRVEARGTRRRLQALTVIGWTPRMIAAHANTQANTIERWLLAATVTHATASTVQLMYGRLRLNTPLLHSARDRRESQGAIDRARKARWLAPLAWDDIDRDDDPDPERQLPASCSDAGGAQDIDPVAVERAVEGDRSIVLNRVETGLAIDLLTARGHSLRDIAARLGISDRTVTRRRRATHLSVSTAA